MMLCTHPPPTRRVTSNAPTSPSPPPPTQSISQYLLCLSCSLVGHPSIRTPHPLHTPASQSVSQVNQSRANCRGSATPAKVVVADDVPKAACRSQSPTDDDDDSHGLPDHPRLSTVALSAVSWSSVAPLPALTAAAVMGEAHGRLVARPHRRWLSCRAGCGRWRRPCCRCGPRRGGRSRPCRRG